MAGTTHAVPLETVVMADVAIVLVVGTVLARLCRRLGQPPVIGEILAGIALGPSLLGLFPGNLPDLLFPADARPYLSAIAQPGLLLFMFLAGWSLDSTLLTGRRGTTAAVAASSVLFPFALGAALAGVTFSRHAEALGPGVSSVTYMLYIGTAMSITAFPVLARIVKDRAMEGTRTGAMAMACAAIGDVLAWCMLVLVIATAQSEGPARLLRVLAETVAYGLVMALVVRPLLHRILTPSALQGPSPGRFVLISAAVLLSSYATSWIGIHAIFGAFAVGLVMPRHSEGAERAKQPFTEVSTLLMPVFFVVTGLSVDVTALGAEGLAEGGLILLVACLGKIVGAAAPARLLGLPWYEARRLGVLMNARGLTELVILDVGRRMRVIDDQVFTLMVLTALITTGMAVPLLGTGTPKAAVRPGPPTPPEPDRAGPEAPLPGKGAGRV
ncbi:cation:proton antiporter [Streptomyces sp. NPDC014733]|uniref:cation:proton antiporter domain-containing protein n=1 Tax=Streptomyces sp. NPDC014733 TaxID=3364885 RepID=UPI0036F83277